MRVLNDVTYGDALTRGPWITYQRHIPTPCLVRDEQVGRCAPTRLVLEVEITARRASRSRRRIVRLVVLHFAVINRADRPRRAQVHRRIAQAHRPLWLAVVPFAEALGYDPC